MRRARQRGVDDLLDLLEGEREFGQLLAFQVIAQGGVVVHGRSFFVIPGRASWREPGIQTQGTAMALDRTGFA